MAVDTKEDAEARRVAAWKAATACIDLLKTRFGVRRAFVFGSLAGHSPWHARSDIDIAVEGLAPERYFEALRACWDLLPEGMELHLITLESATLDLRHRILEGREMPTGSLAALRQEVELELANLERLIRSMESFQGRLQGEPDEFAMRSIGSLLHDFYSGIERIFERIAVRIDGDLPVGPHWHTYLLQRMMNPWMDVRPAVIDRELAARLADYMRFRHLFRHTYGFELEWAKCRPLVEGMRPTFQSLRARLIEFLEQLGAGEGNPKRGTS
ncbi:MAG: nucleotidyltransferase family protein [Thermoflexus sp.]